ncbi:MAG: hypothetical protein IJ960_01115 [Oscillospiraceae bacterium]|nr:hypothetical protein [Oscillospiraceae bacterium]
MRDISLKTVIKAIFLAAMVGLTVWGISFLNQEASKTDTEAEKWVADAHTEAESKWELAAENDSFRLFFNPGNTRLRVEDKVHGTTFLSNPENAEKDPVAFGQNKSLVQALLDVTYVDDQSASYTVNSFMGSTKEGTYRYEYADNGVYINFQFEKQEFEIPCFFGITEEGFVARVLGEEIVQHGALRISNVSLLPFFGSGSREEEGYMVVPDGSGAIIKFNNQKQTYQGYSQSVYGRNLAQNVQNYTQVTQNAMMPVFGICRQNGSMLAVITNGASMSTIKANVSGKIAAANHVYPVVSFIQSENNTLLSGSDNEEVSTMLSQQTKDFTYEVTYFLLNANNGYVEMADRYRQYLIEQGGMNGADASGQQTIGLDFIGGMKTRKTFLGVPYQAVEPLTTFADVQRIALEVRQMTGKDILVFMEDTLKGGSRSKMPVSLSYASSLGGQRGYQQMTAALAQAGIPFYPMYDTATLKASGKGYSSLDTARNVSRSASRQYDYLLSSGARETDKPAVYLLTPASGAEVTAKLVSSAESKGISALGITGITNKMYGDYRKQPISQLETEIAWISALANAAEHTDRLLLDGVFAYGFAYADAISNVPTYSSSFDVEDDTIPFYQLVMSGTAELYGTPMNDNGNLRHAFLRCVEYGVSPTFRLMSAAPAALQDTDYQFYFSLSYEDWKDQIGAMSEELADATLGSRLVHHQKLAENVYKSTFADGSVIYVNYGSEAARVGRVQIPAMDFVREEAQK